jgi:transketolase
MAAPQLEPLTSGALARRARGYALEMVHRAKASHIGSALSVIDILAVLYADVLNIRPWQPKWPERDRLIVSKGHAAVGLYAVLGECGFFPTSEFSTYGQDGARLMGHVSHHVPGVELSTGSLGHGLPVASGLALGLSSRVFCVLSDGELNEGSNWEAIMFAAHHRLTNLTAVVDYNKIQSFGRVDEVMRLEPLADKFSAFGWHVVEVDGHDHNALRAAFNSFHAEKPVAVIAHTTKGKGVDYMEDNLAWHYKSPNDEQLEKALKQVAR